MNIIKIFSIFLGILTISFTPCNYCSAAKSNGYIYEVLDEKNKTAKLVGISNPEVTTVPGVINDYKITELDRNSFFIKLSQFPH